MTDERLAAAVERACRRLYADQFTGDAPLLMEAAAVLSALPVADEKVREATLPDDETLAAVWKAAYDAVCKPYSPPSRAMTIREFARRLFALSALVQPAVADENVRETERWENCTFENKQNTNTFNLSARVQPAPSGEPVGVVAPMAVTIHGCPTCITAVHWYGKHPPVGTPLYSAPPPAAQPGGRVSVPRAHLELAIDFFMTHGAGHWNILDEWRAALMKGRDDDHA